jgi:hypothetical protein
MIQGDSGTMNQVNQARKACSRDMNPFTWLLIGHLLGDWVLQNDWMARGKRAGLLTLAGTVHVAIYTATVMCALWFSGTPNRDLAFYLGAGAAVSISHWLIDSGNGVERWMRFYGQSHLEVVRMMVDQVLHLLVLALIAWAAEGWV